MEKKGKPSFKEAVFVLLLIVSSIAIGVVGLKLSPNIATHVVLGLA